MYAVRAQLADGSFGYYRNGDVIQTNINMARTYKRAVDADQRVKNLEYGIPFYSQHPTLYPNPIVSVKSVEVVVEIREKNPTF